MLKTIIHSFNDLDKWLSNNFYFEDGHVLTIKENPLEIIVGFNVKGTYKANSERHILPFKIIPTKIYEWTFCKMQDFVNTLTIITSLIVIYEFLYKIYDSSSHEHLEKKALSI